MEKMPHEEYRDNLAQELKESRSKGSEGKKEAKEKLDGLKSKSPKDWPDYHRIEKYRESKDQHSIQLAWEKVRPLPEEIKERLVKKYMNFSRHSDEEKKDLKKKFLNKGINNQSCLD